MPEWRVERGIGETRFALVEQDEIVEARILLDGVVPYGSVIDARLKTASARNAVALTGDEEYLLPKGAPGHHEGARIRIEVTREKIGGGERWKRPVARLAGADIATEPVEGRTLPFPSPRDELEDAGWSDLLDEARSGIIRFSGGELRVSPTPAMTLIDIDGTLPASELAIAGARAAALAIRRHGIGGSIGIDFPTVEGKAARQAIGEVIDRTMDGPFERTAVNGFGFLQLVRPRRHASTFELAIDRPAFEARALLRRAAREAGAIRLAANPAVVAILQGRSDWLEQLTRQVGGPVTLRADPALAMSAGHAEHD